MIEVVGQYIIPATFSLLPELASRDAWLMLMGIGLQESRFLHRRQVKGPAVGFWQFERIATLDVLTHPRSATYADRFCRAVGYDLTGLNNAQSTDAIHPLLAHNDVLACGFARLKMFVHPRALPAPGDVAGSWRFYLAAWRPGRPHPETWPALYEEAGERQRLLTAGDSRLT